MRAQRLQDVWERALIHTLQFLFKGFWQDVFLSLPGVQEAVLRALRSRSYRTVVAMALQTPPPGTTFASLDGYYVDPTASSTLQFSALAALSTHLQADEVLAPAQLLPQVGRVLLQTEEQHGARFLEAVASALASQMNAGLLLVDGMLLATLAAKTYGSSPETFLAAFTSAATPMAARDAARLELAWRALREVLYEMEQPTVVYVRNAEALLCSSYEAHEAFMAVFGKQDELALEGATSRAPLVLIGGTSVSESAAARAGVRPQRQQHPGLIAPGLGSSGGEEGDEGDEGSEGSLRPKPGRGSASNDLLGLEDEIGIGDLLRSLSQMAQDKHRPNTRKLLRRVFPTRVKLAPPPAGPIALRHQQRMQRDAAEECEEENYRAAAAVAASTGVKIPPKSSGTYGDTSGTRLTKGEWGKVLSWAVAMQTLQAKQVEVQEEQQGDGEDQQGTEQVLALQLAAEASDEATLVQAGSSKDGEQEALPTTGDGLRQRRLVPSPSAAAATTGEAAGAGEKLSASLSTRLRSAPRNGCARPTLAASLWLGVWQSVNPLRLAASAIALPGRLGRAAFSAACAILYRLPLIGGSLEAIVEGQLSLAQLESELQQLEAELAQLAERKEASSSSTPSVVGAGSSKLDGSGSGALMLSDTAVRFGLGMLQRSSGGLKQSIEPANTYERALIAEVLSPEDCGRGFSEVGALGDAKAALREAVQLPLKHPDLFTGGALARPSKGVLLFGPPGTGKTLVARAAAAECGAAFLALNPSAVASKWFGDSVKYIRAAFTLAAKLAPAVIFIDEVDALLGRRSSSKEHEALREMKNELMQQWDGIRAGRGRVVVLGPTNRPFDLDEAALRRFTHRVFIGLPDRAAREAILRVVLEGERLAQDVDVAKLAERTSGYSGSDIRQLCVQAAMRPVRAFLEHDNRSTAAATEAVAAGPSEESVGGVASQQEVHQEDAATGRANQLDSSEHGGVAAEGEPGSDATPAAHSRSASQGSTAVTIEQQHDRPAPTGSTVPSSAGSTAAGSLRMVPHLYALLRQAESIAALPANPKTDLRATNMQDFEEALCEISPSVDPESGTVQELNEWNKQYGTTANKAGVRGRRLTYYT